MTNYTQPAEVPVTVDQYAAICDTVERAWQHWPVDSYRDDGGGHTSAYARRAAFRVLDILGLKLPPMAMDRDELAAVVAYVAKHSSPDAGCRAPPLRRGIAVEDPGVEEESTSPKSRGA